MADLKLVGAVAIKVRPDASKFREETQTQIRRELAGVHPEVDVEVDADTTRAKDKVRRAKAEMEKDAVTLRVDYDDSSLRRTEQQLKDRAGFAVNITADRSSLERAIAQINKELNKIHGIEDDLELQIGLDEASLLEARKELQARMDGTPVNVRVDMDDQGSLKRTRAKLDAMMSDLRSIDIKVQPNAESIAETRRRIDNLIQDENGQNVDLEVQPTGLALVAARLGYASRARTVPFYVTVNKKSLAVAEGLMKSLAGINVLQKTGNFLENMISNFDKIAIAGAGWASVIGSLADSLIYLVGAAFSVGGGLAQIVGLLALAPTAFGVLASTMIIGQAVFKDFGRAVAGDTDALNNLPAAGQKAARMMKGVWDQLRQDISQNFWDKAGSSMLAFVQHALPAFTKGLSTAATGLGTVFSGVLDSFTNLAITGGLKDMFKGLQGFFEEGAKGATSLWNALNTLGLNGASMLPKFGKWLADISQQFDNWIQAAHDSGDITRWINNGIRSLQSLWSAAGSTINIFKALTRAFDDAGHTGLGGFANSLSRISNIMLGEPFQSQISNIFEGARKGASGLNAGIRDLGNSFMNSSRYVGAMLEVLGQLAGGAVTALSLVFDNPRFQTGTLDALNGMKAALHDLTPGFSNLGNTIGHLGEIAGAVFKGIAPLMNTISRMLSQSFDAMGDNFVKIVPQLMSLMNGFLTTFNGPLQVILQGLNLILTAVNSLPGPIRSVTVALVSMLLLRKEFGAFFLALDNGWKRMNASAGNGVTQDGILLKLRNAWSMTATSVSTSAERMVPTTLGSRFKALATTVGGAARGIGRSISTAFLGLTGGWIGLAVIAIGTAFAVLGQKAADARAKMDALQATLDKVNGSVTDDTILNISKALTNVGGSGGGKSPVETMKLLGVTARDTATQIAAGGDAYKHLQDTLTGAYAAWQKGIESVKNQNPQDQLKAGSAALQDYFQKLGFTGDMSKLTGQDILNLGLAVQAQNGDLAVAKNSWQDINGTMQDSTQRTLDFNDAMTKLHDTTSDMPSRIQAFKDAMDVLNGKTRTTAEITKDYNTAVSDMGDFLSNATANGEKFNDVIDKSTGAINTVSRQGQGLYSQLQSLTGQEIGIVIDMQERGAKPEEITKSLQAAKQAWIDQAHQAGISAEAAGKAWDNMMGGIPKEVATVIEAKGAGVATGQVKNYQDTLAKLDGTKAIAHLLGDDSDVAEKVINSSNKLSDFNKIVATATAKLDPTQADAVRLQIIANLAKMAATDPTVKAYLDPRILESARQAIIAHLQELGHMKPTPQVLAQIDQATTNLNYINNLLNDLNGKTAVTHVQNVIRTVNEQQYVTIGNPNTTGRRASVNGNRNGSLTGSKYLPELVKFATGGFHYERPGNAKIYSAASTARMFAEPSTGGEAYIPMSISKRTRSMNILSEVASRFGMQVTKAQQFANGTPVAPSGPSVDAQVHIGTINTVDPQAAMRELQQKRRDAMALAGRPL